MDNNNIRILLCSYRNGHITASDTLDILESCVSKSEESEKFLEKFTAINDNIIESIKSLIAYNDQFKDAQK